MAAYNTSTRTFTDGLVLTATDLNTERTDILADAATAASSGLAAKAPLASPALTGTPTAPTATTGTNTTQVATTAFVLANAVSGGGSPATTTPLMDGVGAAGSATAYARGDHVHPTDTSRAPLASPTFTGTVTIPAGASISGFATLASPTFTGTVTIPAGASISGFAPLASPALTGTPTAPTAANGTNTTQVATTAFVLANASGGSATLTANTYTTSGAILTTDSTATLNATTVLAMTLANGTVAKRIIIKKKDASGGAHTVTAHVEGVSGTVLPFNSPNGGDAYELEWDVGLSTWKKLNFFDNGLQISDNGSLSGNPASGDIVAIQSSSTVFKYDASNWMVKSNNLSGLTNLATARSNLGVAIGSLGVSFDQGAVVANGTIKVIAKAKFAFTINSLDYEVGSAGGSFTAAVQINGTNVTGLSAVAVSSSTSANAAATAANAVAIGDVVTVVISGTTGSPTGANLQINFTR